MESLREPELRRLFQSATETVAADLQQLNGNEKPFANCTLRIPTEHADAWLNALNQARLVIAAKNNFNEGELCDHYRSPDRFAPRSESFPGKLLRILAGVYPARETIGLASSASRGVDAVGAFCVPAPFA